MSSHPLGNVSGLVFDGRKSCSLAFGAFFIHPSTFHALTCHMQDEMVLS